MTSDFPAEGVEAVAPRWRIRSFGTGEGSQETVVQLQPSKYVIGETTSVDHIKNFLEALYQVGTEGNRPTMGGMLPKLSLMGLAARRRR